MSVCRQLLSLLFKYLMSDIISYVDTVFRVPTDRVEAFSWNAAPSSQSVKPIIPSTTLPVAGKVIDSCNRSSSNSKAFMLSMTIVHATESLGLINLPSLPAPAELPCKDFPKHQLRAEQQKSGKVYCHRNPALVSDINFCTRNSHITVWKRFLWHFL